MGEALIDYIGSMIPIILFVFMVFVFFRGITDGEASQFEKDRREVERYKRGG